MIAELSQQKSRCKNKYLKVNSTQFLFQLEFHFRNLLERKNLEFQIINSPARFESNEAQLQMVCMTFTHVYD